MKMSTEYFHIAQPVEKDEIVKFYREITDVIQTIICPFGLSSDVVGYIGNDNARAILAHIYRKIEEVTSRKLYSVKGIKDENVASALHKYIEVDRNQEVLRAVEGSVNGVNDVIELPSIVPLPTADVNGVDFRDLCGAEYKVVLDQLSSSNTTIQLMRNIMQVTRSSFEKFYSICRDEADNVGELLEMDKTAFEKFGVVIRRCQMDPSIFSAQKFYSSTIGSDFLVNLDSALIADIVDANGTVVKVKFTAIQYLTLLEINCASEAFDSFLKEELAKLTYSPEMNFQAPPPLSSIRTGAYEISPLTNPTISFVQQLLWKQSQTSDNDEKKAIEASLVVTKEALDILEKAKSLMESERYEDAVKLISAAINMEEAPEISNSRERESSNIFENLFGFSGHEGYSEGEDDYEDEEEDEEEKEEENDDDSGYEDEDEFGDENIEDDDIHVEENSKTDHNVESDSDDGSNYSIDSHKSENAERDLDLQDEGEVVQSSEFIGADTEIANNSSVKEDAIEVNQDLSSAASTPHVEEMSASQNVEINVSASVVASSEEVVEPAEICHDAIQSSASNNSYPDESAHEKIDIEEANEDCISSESERKSDRQSESEENKQSEDSNGSEAETIEAHEDVEGEGDEQEVPKVNVRENWKEIAHIPSDLLCQLLALR